MLSPSALVVSRYRAFAGDEILPLRPLTLLHGRNNAGKELMLRDEGGKPSWEGLAPPRLEPLGWALDAHVVVNVLEAQLATNPGPAAARSVQREHAGTRGVEP